LDVGDVGGVAVPDYVALPGDGGKALAPIAAPQAVGGTSSPPPAPQSMHRAPATLAPIGAAATAPPVRRMPLGDALCWPLLHPCRQPPSWQWDPHAEVEAEAVREALAAAAMTTVAASGGGGGSGGGVGGGEARAVPARGGGADLAMRDDPAKVVWEPPAPSVFERPSHHQAHALAHGGAGAGDVEGGAARNVNDYGAYRADVDDTVPSHRLAWMK